MKKPPFKEQREYRELNAKRAENLEARAILGNNTNGIAVFIGSFIVCLTQNQAKRLAIDLVNSLEHWKEVETSENRTES